MQPSVQVEGLDPFPLPDNMMRPTRVKQTHFVSHSLISSSLSVSHPHHFFRAPYPHGILYVVLMVGEQEGRPSWLVLGTRQSVVLPWGKARQPASPSQAPGRERRYPGFLPGDSRLVPAAQGRPQQGLFPWNLGLLILQVGEVLDRSFWRNFGGWVSEGWVSLLWLFHHEDAHKSLGNNRAGSMK